MLSFLFNLDFCLQPVLSNLIFQMQKPRRCVCVLLWRELTWGGEQRTSPSPAKSGSRVWVGMSLFLPWTLPPSAPSPRVLFGGFHHWPCLSGGSRLAGALIGMAMKFPGAQSCLDCLCYSGFFYFDSRSICFAGFPTLLGPQSHGVSLTYGPSVTTSKDDLPNRWDLLNIYVWTHLFWT